MTAGRCWLIQWHRDEMQNCLVGCHTRLTPALGRHLDEVAPGDRVVMWVTGRGADAGVWALGLVCSDIYEKQHLRNYAKPADGERLRPTVDIQLTHLLDQAVIDRPTLRGDNRFAGYALFERGRAQGPNPWPLTETQWTAVTERVPAWATIDRTASTYRVTVDLLADIADEEAGRAALLETLRQRRYDELSFEAEGLDQSEAAWEYMDLPAATLPTAVTGAVVTWETTIEATTAYRALLHVFKELRQDAATLLAAGSVSIERPPGLPEDITGDCA